MIARLTVMAVAVGCALTGAASPAPADRFLLAGNSRGLWLVRLAPQGKTFDVLAKPSATKWRWMSRGLLGSPAAAAAIDESLHVLLAKPTGYLKLPLSGGDGMPGLSPVDKRRWPGDAVPVAACAAEDFAGDKGSSLVVVVLRDQAAGRITLGVFQNGVFENMEGLSESRPAGRPAAAWRHVVDLPGLPAGSGILAAVRAGRLYLLIRAAGRNRLVT